MENTILQRIYDWLANSIGGDSNVINEKDASILDNLERAVANVKSISLNDFIPEDVLENLHLLNGLEDMHIGWMASIQDDFFTKLPCLENLTRLDISVSEKIGNFLIDFSKIPNLTELAITGNLYQMQRIVFAGDLVNMKGLEVLCFSFDNMEWEHVKNIKYLSNLKKLKIVSKEAIDFPLDFFDNLSDLIELDLTLPNTPYPPYSIESIKRLKSLVLASKTINIDFSVFNKLEYLSVSVNFLQKEIINFPQCLRKLGIYVTEHRKTYINLTKLPNLLSLSLQFLNNNGWAKECIFDYMEGLCNLDNLKELEIESNLIKRIPKDISHFKNIIAIKIVYHTSRYGGLVNKRFPKAFQKMPVLQYIHLENFPIETLPKWISDIKNLKQLYLYNTPINSFPNTIKNMKHLRTIHIDMDSVFNYGLDVNKMQENLSDNCTIQIDKRCY